jgi:hypothetical protein
MKEHYTHYLVATSAGRWGRGADLKTALQSANALNKSETNIKKNLKTLVYINIQLEEDRLTQERVDALAKGPFFRVTGYKAGEFMLPWIDDYGAPHYFGVLEEISVPPFSNAPEQKETL